MKVVAVACMLEIDLPQEQTGFTDHMPLAGLERVYDLLSSNAKKARLTS